MSVEKAKAHYLGKDGCRKLNCAQSVVAAFKDRCALPETMVDEYAAFGGGRAPTGECGALYAARAILEKRYPDRIKDCIDVLVAHGGSSKCQEIRAARKLPCVGCVEKMAECIHRVV